MNEHHTEEWRPISDPVFSFAEVSSLGRLRRAIDGTEVSQGVSSGGYMKLWKRIGGGRKTTRLVHVLVATSFIGPKPTPRHVVNHKNRVRTDNRPDNLEWVTQLENIRHGIRSRAAEIPFAFRGYDD